MPFFGVVYTESVVNSLLAGLLISAILLMLNQHDNLVIFRQMVVIVGITALLRPIIFCMTSLPDPSPHNPARLYPYKNLLIRALMV